MSDVATPADIDTVIEYSFGQRLGVAGLFEIADLAGLDVYLAVAEPLLRVLESSPEVPSILRQKVERGELGVMSGQGFYTWTPESAAAVQDRIGRALVALSRLRSSRGGRDASTSGVRAAPTASG